MRTWSRDPPWPGTEESLCPHLKVHQFTSSFCNLIKEQPWGCQTPKKRRWNSNPDPCVPTALFTTTHDGVHVCTDLSLTPGWLGSLVLQQMPSGGHLHSYLPQPGLQLQQTVLVTVVLVAYFFQLLLQLPVLGLQFPSLRLQVKLLLPEFWNHLFLGLPGGGGRRSQAKSQSR